MGKEWIECWCALYIPPPTWVTSVQFPKLFPPQDPYGACSVSDMKKYFGSDIFLHVHKEGTHLMPTLW